MKLQYLAVIFLIIILPILIVLTTYFDYHADAIKLKNTYDTKLLDATYDGLKSYQMNTINNAISDISASKIDELEAAVKTFQNSISNVLGYTGYKTTTMEEYIPAVVFGMYDGYYIYSPYTNVLTGVPRIREDSTVYIDEDYKDNVVLEGLKSYIYYACRYKIDDNNHFVITYTLDNYITVQGLVNGTFVNKYGYLIDGIIKKSNTEYEYNGVVFKEDTTECLKEFLGDKEYSYAKLNGTKYYLDGNEIFYINVLGEKAIQASRSQNEEAFNRYKSFIENNNSAYRYYRDSYEFTSWVRSKLINLNTSHALDTDGNLINNIAKYDIFKVETDKYIQDVNSKFNQHRTEVIRYTIEKNLSAAIAGYNNYFKNSESDFVMPNISETDWEVIQNNISMITFLQGFKIGGRDYNEYCVVANNLNKEFVSEDDIYILGNNRTYYKVNDKTLPSLATGLGYKPGVWKLNFEQRIHLREEAEGNYTELKYYPLSYKSGSKIKPYLGSYSSIIASTSVDSSEPDLYKYLRATNEDGTYKISNAIRTAYYTALGRERYGQYSVNNDIYISEVVIDNDRHVADVEVIIGGERVTIPGGATLSQLPGEYEDVNNGIVIYMIPEDETVTNWNEDSNGNGIKDVQEKYDQFVWVPVKNAVLDLSGITVDTNSIKNKLESEMSNNRYPMAIKVDSHNYIGVLYDFSKNSTDNTVKITLYTSNNYNNSKKWTPLSDEYNREPVYLDNSTYGDANISINTVGITSESIQKEFNKMVENVKSKKGFWVGRYETSKMSGNSSLDNSNKVSVTRGATDGTNQVNWYRMYVQQKNYSKLIDLNYTNSSSMIWGSQWDQIMIWMKNVNSADGNSKYILNSIGKANFSDSVVGVNDGYTSTSSPAPTGCFHVKNIFDLAGNLYDWTLEASSTKYRVRRRKDIYK